MSGKSDLNKMYYGFVLRFDGEEARRMTDSRMTARLRPGVDRRLPAAAVLQRARIGRILNGALGVTPPSLGEISAPVAATPCTAQGPFDGDRS